MHSATLARAPWTGSPLNPIAFAVEHHGLAVDDRVGRLVVELADHLEAVGDGAQAAHAVDLLKPFSDSFEPDLAGRVSGAAVRLAARGYAEAEDLDGAVVGVEARVWQACRLLDSPSTRAEGVALVEQLVAELDAVPGLSEVEVGWRCQLAFPVGRAGRPDLATQLVAPLHTSGDEERWSEPKTRSRSGSSAS